MGRERELPLRAGGANDDAHDLNRLLASNQSVALEPKTYNVASKIVIPDGKSLVGVPGKTVIRGTLGFNILFPGSNSTVSGITVDGAFENNDRKGGSGIVLDRANGVHLERVVVRNISYQGIALVRSNNNIISNCMAQNCGHRGINVSEDSSNNSITGFRATDCWRAGVLLGYHSNHNTVSDFYVDGFRQSVGGAGLWVHMNSDYNTFSNFTIGPEKSGDSTCPSILLGSGCVGNLFEHGKLTGVGRRGIYIWNENVDHVKDLHTINGALQNNRFLDIKIEGTGLPRSYGIGFKSDNGQKIGPNEFDNITISGFAVGVEDIDAHAKGLSFRNLHFGKIGAEKMHLFNPPR